MSFGKDQYRVYLGLFFKSQPCTFLCFQASNVISPPRKLKVAANQGAPPKRKTHDFVDNPESSKANEAENKKPSDVQNVGVVAFLIFFLFFYCSFVVSVESCWFYFCIMLGTVLPVTASAVAIKCKKMAYMSYQL